MPRILVTGGNGLLGTKVIERALDEPSIEIISTSRDTCQNGYLGSFPFAQMDITDEESVQRVIGQFKPDVVIHTAAMTNVDGCETNRDDAWRINTLGTEHVATACASIGARLV